MVAIPLFTVPQPPQAETHAQPAPAGATAPAHASAPHAPASAGAMLQPAPTNGSAALPANAPMDPRIGAHPAHQPFIHSGGEVFRKDIFPIYDAAPEIQTLIDRHLSDTSVPNTSEYRTILYPFVDLEPRQCFAVPMHPDKQEDKKLSNRLRASASNSGRAYGRVFHVTAKPEWNVYVCYRVR